MSSVMRPLFFKTYGGCVNEAMKRIYSTAISTLLILSVTVNLYYVYIGSRNNKLLHQMQVLIKSQEENDRKNLLRMATSAKQKELLPNEYAMKNPLYWKYFKQVWRTNKSNWYNSFKLSNRYLFNVQVIMTWRVNNLQ